MDYLNYLNTVFLFFTLISCNENSLSDHEKLATVDSCYFSLGNSHKTKEFVLNFPFSAYQLENMNWRCTGSEPYCKSFGNEELEVNICHRFNNQNLYYNKEINEFEDKRNKKVFENSHLDLCKIIKKKLAEEFKISSKRYSSPSEFVELAITCNDYGDIKIMDYGYIQINGNRKYLKRTHTANSNEEYFELEFNSTCDNVDLVKLQKEIQFIIDNVLGKPMHNK